MKLKNLNVRGKLLLLLTTGVLSYTLVSCISSNKVPEIDASLEDTLEDTKDDSLLDDVMDIDKNNNINYKDFLELEEQVNKYNLVKDVNLDDDYNNLSKAAQEDLDNLSIEGVKSLIDTANGDISSVEEARLKQKLKYIKTSSEKYIEKNGTEISIEMLKRAVKAGVCDAVGLEPTSYDSVKINPASSSDPFDITVVIDDPISGVRLHKAIAEDSIYGDAINKIYQLQSQDYNPSLSTIEENAREAINMVKVIAYSGAEEGKKINPEYNYSEVEEKAKTK